MYVCVCVCMCVCVCGVFMRVCNQCDVVCERATCLFPGCEYGERAKEDVYDRGAQAKRVK